MPGNARTAVFRGKSLEARAGIEGKRASGIGFHTSETPDRLPAKNLVSGIIFGIDPSRPFPLSLERGTPSTSRNCWDGTSEV